MRISHKHKFIFFSNPKTASESIRAALDPYSDIFSAVDAPIYRNHVTPHELKIHFIQKGWAWNTYFKFCFVRNPWDRLVSYYHYFKPDKNYNLVWIRGPWHYKNALPFDKFVESLRDHTYFGLLQSKYFLGENNDKLIDYVGKYENIMDDFSAVCAKLNIEASLPLKNKNIKRMAYQVYYSAKTRKIVEEIFHKEIGLFNYKYGKLSKPYYFYLKGKIGSLNLISKIKSLLPQPLKNLLRSFIHT